MTFSAVENGSLKGKTIVFYVVDGIRPTIKSSNALHVSVTVAKEAIPMEDGNYWEVSIKFGAYASSEYTLTYTPGVQTYDVTFTNGTDYTFMNTNGTLLKSGTFAKGDTISFTLSGVTDGKTAVIRENSVDLAVNEAEGNLTYDATSKVYTYKVTKDATISAVLKDVTYSVTVPATQTGYTLVSADGNYKVAHGGTFTFYVTPADAYTIKTVTYTMGETGTETAANKVGETQYIINNVTGAVNIEVATESKTYPITLIGGTGSTIEAVNSSSPVNHGGSFTFKVTVDEAYKASTPVISINGTPIAATFNNGICTYGIKDITEAKTVSVSNLTMNTYNVTLTPGKGYTLSPIGNTTVTHGSKFQFRLDTDASVSDATVSYTVGGETTIMDKSGNGVYTIENVTSDITVTVTTEGKTFAATVNNDEGDHATVTPVEGNTADSIPYNGSYSFKVEADLGYSIASVSVNNAVVTPIGDTYTVRNVVDNLTIVVETVENTLTVNYESTEKNHEYAKTIVYTYTQLATAKLPELNTCKLHTFDGWYDGENKVDSLSSKQESIKTANLTIDLTAKYVVDTAKLASLLKLEATISEKTKLANENYRITFRTKVTTDATTDACVTDFVKIIKHGTILANAESVDFSKVDFNGTALTETGTYNGIYSYAGENEVYLYYIQCAYSWSEFNSALVAGDAKSSIILRVSNVGADEQLYAAGWVEVKVGNETFRIISGVNGVITVEDTVDTPAE